MKYLIIGPRDEKIQELIEKLRNSRLHITDNKIQCIASPADAIITEPDEISSTAEMFPDTTFLGIYNKFSKIEEYKKFNEDVVNMSKTGTSDWPDNIQVFQSLGQDETAELTTASLYNTKIVHNQLENIINEVIRSSELLETKDGKIALTKTDWSTGEDTTEYVTPDTLAQQLLYDSIGFDTILKQWLTTQPTRPCLAKTKKTAIYETIDDFYEIIYNLYEDKEIRIHNDTDVFWIEDTEDPDNDADATLGYNLALYYGISGVKTIIANNEYACIIPE